MKLYRIAKQQYIQDLTGTGAKLFGGRWNHKGISILYTAETRSLATLELLVHTSPSLIPNDLNIIEIQAPESIIQINIKDLPKDWSTYPAPLTLADIGSKWANENKSLLLRVPSSIIKEEFNVLINPLHQDFKLVSINSIDKFNFDKRLFK